MKLTLRYWHGAIFCVGAFVVVFTRLSNIGGPALSRRSYPVETSYTRDDTAMLRREPWGSPRKRVVPANPSDEWKDKADRGGKYICNMNAPANTENLKSNVLDYNKIGQDYDQLTYDSRSDVNLISDEVGELGLSGTWQGQHWVSKSDVRICCLRR
jgi:hypothetical protein